jgi:RNA polymerase sigma factor (sigma-70 family)
MTDIALQSLLHQLRRLAAPTGAGGLTDAQLLRRFIEGRDEAAFEVLVWRHGSLVLGCCRKLLGHEQDAEDAFQATFLTLARKAGSLAAGASLSGWLHRVASRIALRLRAQRRLRQAREGHAVTWSVVPGARTDSAGVEASELWGILTEELQCLPDRYRWLLTACYLQGKTHAEAARELQRPLGSIARQLTRGCELLRTRLTSRGVCLTTGAMVPLLADQARAALSTSLVLPTVTAALEFTAGGVVSTPAVTLAKGVIQSMFLSKVKAVAGLLLLFAALTAGTVGLARQALTQPAPQVKPPEKVAEQPQAAAEKKARLDVHGDPLPEEALARLGTVRWRHGGMIEYLAFTPDGKTLVSQGRDALRFWDVATGKQVRLFAEPGKMVFAAALSADGRRVAAMMASPLREDDKRFTYFVWDVADGRTVAQFEGAFCHYLRFSPDGRRLAAFDINGFQFKLYDVANGLLALSITDETAAANLEDLLFSPDGKTLLTASESHVKGSAIRFWDTASGKEVRHLTEESYTLSSMVLSADGSLLAFARSQDRRASRGKDEDPERSIRLWDLSQWKEIRKTVAPAKRDRFGDPYGFTALAISADGKALVGGGNGFLGTWDLPDGKERWLLESNTLSPRRMALSRDGKTLALSSSDTFSFLQLFDMAGGKEVTPKGEPRICISEAVLSPDGKLAVTGDWRQTLRVWDTQTGAERHQLVGDARGVRCFALAHDGRTLFSASGGKTVRVWDIREGKELRQLQAPGKDTTQLVLSTDDKTLALLHDTKVVLLDTRDGKTLREFAEVGEMWGMAFAPDARSLVGWGHDGAFHVMDVANGTTRRLEVGVRYSLAAGLTQPIAFSPDGRLAVLNLWHHTSFEEPVLLVYDLRTGEELRRITTSPSQIILVSFSPDGRTLVYTTGLGTAIGVELATGKERYRFAGHRGPVWALAFAADGKTLLTGSGDTTALVWDLSGRLAARAPLTPADLDGCWADLLLEDAARAYLAIRKLSQVPELAVAYLGKHLAPASPADEKQLARLIADLDSEQFEVRDRATAELEKLGELAGPACRRTLEGQPALEGRRRLEALLAKQEKEAWFPTGERLRALRVTEVLERIATAEARQLLANLANGTPAVRLTREAKATLERLAQRPAPAP